MLQKLRGNNSKGFTLIELMIVIAIIGILAAIAIPNFIAYRNKAFCSAAETDANSIAAGLADYFSIPSHVTMPTINADGSGDLSGGNGIAMSGSAPNQNTNTTVGPVDSITISVTDGSGRCPTDYQNSNPEWAASVFTKQLQ